MVNTELDRYDPPLDTDTATLEKYQQAVTAAKEKYLTVAFLSGSAEHHHAQMMRDIENDYLRGNKTTYPETLTRTYEIAVNWKGSGQRRPRNASRHHELGSTFVQEAQQKQPAHSHKPRQQAWSPPAHKTTHNNVGAQRRVTAKPKEIVCFGCSKPGHKIRECPNAMANS